MGLPSMQTLRGIAMGTGIVGISGCVYMQLKATDNIGKSPYFRAAFKVLRADESAIKLLGEPIKQLGFDITHKDNFCDGRYAQYHVRVKGPTDRGMMYFWAALNDDKKWIINRMELELNKHPDKRLRIKTDNLQVESNSSPMPVIAAAPADTQTVASPADRKTAAAA